jgi:putative flippase GtrA
LTLEDRLHNPLMQVATARYESHAQFYKAALKDARFSSSFGMYPGPVPEKGSPIGWTLIKFGFVGGLGVFLNQYVLLILTSIYGLSFLLVNAFLSSQVAIFANFALNEVLVFRSRSGASLVRKLGLFTAVSSADLVVRLPLLLVITNFLSGHWFWANIAAIMLTFGARFLISEKKIWAKTPKPKQASNGR